MPDMKPETLKGYETAPNAQDIGAWLKRPLAFTAPTWAFLAAGLLALAVLGIALD